MAAGGAVARVLRWYGRCVVRKRRTRCFGLPVRRAWAAAAARICRGGSWRPAALSPASWGSYQAAPRPDSAF